MAETSNIAQMAEKMAEKIFNEFLWTRSGEANANWKCEMSDVHGVDTHPSDVVFWYDNPYSGTRQFVQCDLKSYAKNSIGGSAISGALLSLAKQVTCAEISNEWQAKYVMGGVTPEVAGLLFIYNHDAEYDRDFGQLLEKIDTAALNLPPKSKLFILGPDDINWLDRVVHDIKLMRGDEDSDRKVPGRERCAFYYPDLTRKPNVQVDNATAATLEMLTSPWIVMQYFEDDDDKRAGLILFQRRDSSVDEFKYLIDYLSHFQLLESKSLNIDIRVSDDPGAAKVKFEKAVFEYLASISENRNTDLAKRLNKIRVNAIPEITTSYSQTQIGMDYGR